MEDPRFQSFEDFWPYYIGEHRDPRCRWVHFVGTSGFLATFAACFAPDPLRFGAAVAIAAVIALVARRMEARRNAVPALLAMIVVVAAANPLVLAGVVFAYGCAWVGHFRIEKNRPATFTYPMWSLAGDFKMFGQMLRGRLWTGDGSEIAPLPAK